MVYQESEKRKAFRIMEDSLLNDKWDVVKSLFDEYGVMFFSNEIVFANERVDYFHTIQNGVFHYLVAHKQTSLVEMMLEQGWNVNEEDGNGGDTALYYVVTYGDKKTLELLIQYGLNINFKNHRGETGFVFAWGEKKVEEFKTLYRNGADVNLRNYKGGYVLDDFDFSDKFGKEIIKILLQEPGRLNERNLKMLQTKRLELLYK